jgi:hypothetical protein
LKNIRIVRVGSSLAYQGYAAGETLALIKRSSLLRQSVYYGKEGFMRLGTGAQMEIGFKYANKLLSNDIVEKREKEQKSYYQRHENKLLHM